MDTSLVLSKVVVLIFTVIFCNKVYGSRTLDVQNYGAAAVSKNDIDANVCFTLLHFCSFFFLFYYVVNGVI